MPFVNHIKDIKRRKNLKKFLGNFRIFPQMKNKMFAKKNIVRLAFSVYNGHKNFIYGGKIMEFYRVALRGLRKLYETVDMTEQKEQIEKVLFIEDEKKSACLFQELVEGKANITRQATVIGCAPAVTEISKQWIDNLIGALLSMTYEFSRAIVNGRESAFTMEFVRKNFGRVVQTIDGTMCENCKHRQISLFNVDSFILPSVITNGLVQGLEQGTVEPFVENLIYMRIPEIEKGREAVKEMVVSSGVPLSHSYNSRVYCLMCGGNRIKKCRFLKSARQNNFIPLG